MAVSRSLSKHVANISMLTMTIKNRSESMGASHKHDTPDDGKTYQNGSANIRHSDAFYGCTQSYRATPNYACRRHACHSIYIAVDVACYTSNGYRRTKLVAIPILTSMHMFLPSQFHRVRRWLLYLSHTVFKKCSTLSDLDA